MVEVIPFRGLHYAELKASVLAPPYDVISPAQRRRLLARDPFNIVRVDLGPTPTPPEWYTKAAENLARWVATGVLVREERPLLYGYQQHFSLEDGRRRVRTGFLARVRLAEWGQGIHRHEHTRMEPRADRLRLMETTQAQLSPVFGLYRDPEGELRRWLEPPAQPWYDGLDEDGVRHIFWPLTDPAAMAALVEGMRSKEVVIADGHHRYETALTYRAERRRAEGNPPTPQPYDYVLMYLTALEDPGLEILATHRVITHLPVLNGLSFLKSCARDFELIPVRDTTLREAVARAAGDTVAIGVELGWAGAWVLRLKDMERARRAAGAGADLAELDVCVLQNLIFRPRLGITPELLTIGELVHYTIHEEEARAAVQRGEAQVAFILNPTKPEQVWQAACRGVTLPPKSTYFYPKLLTGLVINPLDG
jgi:uncharacterized protein (DUF1015 family)